MRGWLVPALLVLGLLGPLAEAQPSQPEIVELPSFTLGDWWHYRVKGDLSGEANSTVERRENLTIEGQVYDVWRINANVVAAPAGRMPTFTNQFVEDKWIVVDDHARLRTHAESEDATQTTTFTPPQREIVFPFDAESEWKEVTNVTREESRSVFGVERPDPEGSVQTYQDRVVGRVVGKVRLNVVAGEFITYLIEFGHHSAQGERFFRWYYAPDACTNVLEEQYVTETDVKPAVTYELTTFQCTQPAPALAPTPEVEDEAPPPSFGDLNMTEDDEPKKKEGWLPGFGLVSWLVAAAATTAFVRRAPK